MRRLLFSLLRPSPSQASLAVGFFIGLSVLALAQCICLERRQFALERRLGELEVEVSAVSSSFGCLDGACWFCDRSSCVSVSGQAL